MPAAVDSIFDVAFWFSDRALNDNEYLQPLKLQYLLYLSQSYFAVANRGRKLVPAVFVAEEVGPIEPSVYRAWTRGRPNFEGEIFLEEEVEAFMDSVWRRFGHHSTEYLAKVCRQNVAYRAALKKAKREEIPLEAMRKSFAKAHNSPSVDQVVRPRLMRSQDGKPVAVKTWKPREVKSSK